MLHFRTNPVLLIMCLWYLTPQTSNSQLPVEGTLREYCNTETFRPQCSSGEVVIIESATYGRHHVGKCIDNEEATVFKDPRYFGCSKNVRRVLDGKCSARKTCEVKVADGDLERDSPCLKGLKMFLEASYSCVQVVEEDRSCVVSLTSTAIHIAASTTSHSINGLHCGSRTQPWLLESPTGQRINISLLDFTPAATDFIADGLNVESFPQNLRNPSHQSGRNNCLGGHQYGYLLEKSTAAVNRKNISLCAELESQGVVNKYVSTSNNIELVLTNLDRIPNYKQPFIFLVKLEAVGCTDLIPPEDAWVKRKVDKIIIGCYSSRQTWQLRCQEGKWIGVVSNCTQTRAADSSHEQQSNVQAVATENYRVVVTVAIAFIGLAICLIIICCGIVCLQRLYSTGVSTSYPYCGTIQQYHRTLISNTNDNKLTNRSQ